MNLVPLPVVVPLVGAAVILFLNTVLPRRWAQGVTLLFVAAEVGISAALVHQAGRGTIVYWFGGWTPRQGVALGISFTVDPLGAGGAVLAGLIVAAAVATTQMTIDDAYGIVHALMLTLLAAMAGFCLTGDLFNLFVFFELMAVSAFALAAFCTGSRDGLRSALNFAITNSVGAFMVLIGIALLYSRTGALNLAQIGRRLAATGHLDRLTILAFALLTVGFLIKAAVVPFHFWLVDTASTAPLPLVMVLAGVLDTLGVYGVARIYWTIFATPVGGHHSAVQAVLVIIGATSAAAGAAMALLFRDARRRLGFVMVSHTGVLLIGVGCLSASGAAGAAVYAIGDGTVKAALFVALGLVGAGTGSVHAVGAGGVGAVGAVGGVGGGVGGGTLRLAPGISTARRTCGVVLLAVGGVAIAGLPLFATGLGKAVIEDAAVAAGYRWVTPVIILASVLSAAAVLDLAWSLFRKTTAGSSAGSPSASPAPTGSQPRAWAPAFVVGAGLLVVSSAATTLARWATGAASRFVDTIRYQQRVLGGVAAPARKLPATVHLSAGGVLVDLLTVLAAVVLAAVLNKVVVAGATTRPSALRMVLARLHDGSIGDSVAWVTVGTAVVGLVLATGLR